MAKESRLHLLVLGVHVSMYQESGNIIILCIYIEGGLKCNQVDIIYHRCKIFLLEGIKKLQFLLSFSSSSRRFWQVWATRKKNEKIEGIKSEMTDHFFHLLNFQFFILSLDQYKNEKNISVLFTSIERRTFCLVDSLN